MNYHKSCEALQEELDSSSNPVTKSVIRDILSKRAVKLEEEIAELIKSHDVLKSHSEALTKVLIDVECEATSGEFEFPAWLYTDVATVMNKLPEQSLLERDSEVAKKAFLAGFDSTSAGDNAGYRTSGLAFFQILNSINNQAS